VIRCLKQAAALLVLARRLPRVLAERWARGAREREGYGAFCVSTAGRQRASEVTGSGLALSAEGRRGSAANRGAEKALREPRQAIEDQSCHGEKLWHREAGFGSANCATRHRKPTADVDGES